MSRKKKLVHDCLGAALTLDERNPKTKLTCLPLRNNVNMVQLFLFNGLLLSSEFYYISMEVVFLSFKNQSAGFYFFSSQNFFLEFPCPAIQGVLDVIPHPATVTTRTRIIYFQRTVRRHPKKSRLNMPLLRMVGGRSKRGTSRREYGTRKGLLDRLGGLENFHWEYPSNHQVFDDDAY